MCFFVKFKLNFLDLFNFSKHGYTDFYSDNFFIQYFKPNIINKKHNMNKVFLLNFLTSMHQKCYSYLVKDKKIVFTQI